MTLPHPVGRECRLPDSSSMTASSAYLTIKPTPKGPPCRNGPSNRTAETYRPAPPAASSRNVTTSTSRCAGRAGSTGCHRRHAVQHAMVVHPGGVHRVGQREAAELGAIRRVDRRDAARDIDAGRPAAPAPNRRRRGASPPASAGPPRRCAPRCGTGAPRRARPAARARRRSNSARAGAQHGAKSGPVGDCGQHRRRTSARCRH